MQASTGGLLVSASAACGSGGGLPLISSSTTNAPLSNNGSAASWINTVGVTTGGDPVYDVTAAAYGADPTGVADSLAAVEAAMTAACATSPSGAIVWFPPGTYAFSNIIPNTAGYWCNGLTLQGSGIRATQLNFPTGSGYAINVPANIRNLNIDGFLIQVGGGSGGSNNGLGGLFIGNFNFSDNFTNLYIIGPATSTASGVSTLGDATQAFLLFDNVRVDYFGGTGAYGFNFSLSGTGDKLLCRRCYSSQAYQGIKEIGYNLATFIDSAADNATHEGWNIAPGQNNLFIGTDLSSESDTGNAFFLNFGGDHHSRAQVQSDNGHRLALIPLKYRIALVATSSSVA